MRLGIMQPYFLPYIGYFQLMKSVDTFIIYDNIKYTKRGWINKNRILVNGSDKLFSIPVKKDSDYLKIGERELANNSLSERKKILRQITNSYAKAPYFASTYPIIEKCFLCEESNLFHYILYSIKEMARHLDINTKIIKSSSIDINHDLRGQDKIIDMCKCTGAKQYINPISGIHLYDREQFQNNDIKLSFIKPHILEYKQFKYPFYTSLSMIDVLMFNSYEEVNKMLQEYDIL